MDMMLEQFKTIFDRPEKVTKLREVILDLAVRGKLVPQDANDEPASILLERIREEKERLIKEKKIKKEFCDDTISEHDVPYLIPNDWEWARLIDLGTYKKGPFGSAITKSMFIPKGENTIKVYEQKNAIKKNIELGNYYISEEYFNTKLSGFEVFAGDIIVSCAGTIGETYIVPENAERGIINQALMKMRIFDGLSIDYFLLYFDYILKKSAIEKSNGSAMKNIPPFSIFKKMLVAIPPLAEQKRIVEKVDLLMSFCDKLEIALEKKIKYRELSAKSVFNAVGNASSVEELEHTLRFILLNFKDLSLGDNAVKELKNCILQLAVQGKLVEQDPNDEPADVLLEKIKEEKERLIEEKKIKKEKALKEIDEEEKSFELPNGWQWIRIGENCLINPRNSIEDNLEASFIPMKLINDGFYNRHTFEIKKWKEIKSGFTHFEEGDIVVAKITPCFENRKSAIMKNLINGVGAGTTELYVIRCLKDTILPEFILCVFKAENFIRGGVQTYTGTAGQQRVKKDYITNLVVAIPPLNEQKRIVEKVDSLMTLCDELEDKIEESKKYSERLMESIIKSLLSN